MNSVNKWKAVKARKIAEIQVATILRNWPRIASKSSAGKK